MAHGTLRMNREKPEAGVGGDRDELRTQEFHTESSGSSGAEKPVSITSWLLQHCMLHQHFRIWKGGCRPSPEL